MAGVKTPTVWLMNPVPISLLMSRKYVNFNVLYSEGYTANEMVCEFFAFDEMSERTEGLSGFITHTHDYLKPLVCPYY